MNEKRVLGLVYVLANCPSCRRRWAIVPTLSGLAFYLRDVPHGTPDWVVSASVPPLFCPVPNCNGAWLRVESEAAVLTADDKWLDLSRFRAEPVAAGGN